MCSAKSLFVLVLLVNALFPVFVNSHIVDYADHVFQQEEQIFESQVKSPYKFDNPIIAYQLLDNLDVFGVVNPGDVEGLRYVNETTHPKVNEKYCQEHRAYVVNHPELIFNEKNIWTNYVDAHNLNRQVIPAFGKMVYAPNTTVHDLPLNVNIFCAFNYLYKTRPVGKYFSCLSQASNHIPGHNSLYRKDYAGQALVDYAESYKSRPQCFNFSQYFPKTWVLVQKDQCINFFKEFNSKRYQKLKKERKVVYFRKIGAFVHEGKGVFPVTDDEETKIRQAYGNGKYCGLITQNNLIQYNVHNLLLVQRRKFGFRSFLLVASSNPIIAFYHDGYARLSLNEYDPNSTDRKTFVTNIGLNLKAAQEEGPFKGMTEAEIQEKTSWSLEDFHKYLLENNLVTDPDWLDNYLRPQFKTIMAHLIRMGQGSFVKKSSVFQLMGLDFVMDENLKLWFIEANMMPLIHGFTVGTTKLMNQMMYDTLEIVTSLLRARMKRVINYINLLTKKVEAGSLSILSLEKQREKFRKISTNKFDPEFPISKGNTFHKIIDENEIGTKRYAGLIKEECL